MARQGKANLFIEHNSYTRQFKMHLMMFVTGGKMHKEARAVTRCVYSTPGANSEAFHTRHGTTTDCKLPPESSDSI